MNFTDEIPTSPATKVEAAEQVSNEDDLVLGSFADDADLLDSIVEEAMRRRHT
jgi:hypothetical protein